MASLSSLLSADHVDVEVISEFLDHLDPRVRLAEIRLLNRREQRRLFDAADGYRPISLDDIVPTEAPLAEVVHEGSNTLPAFRLFAKVFCRTGNGDNGTKLWGYNRTSQHITTAVGPGYFVAEPHREGEVLVDYLQLPPGKPDHWPEIVSNSARLSRFVYNGTQDVLRGVSKHVSIGRAMKGGKFFNAWFILCRVDN